jgi:hypothetical protein
MYFDDLGKAQLIIGTWSDQHPAAIGSNKYLALMIVATAAAREFMNLARGAQLF